VVPPDVRVSPLAADLHVRHVRKSGLDYYLLFNEGAGQLEVRLDLSAKGKRVLLDPMTAEGRSLRSDDPMHLPGHAMQVLAVMA
jgi:hypothetical protein